MLFNRGKQLSPEILKNPKNEETQDVTLSVCEDAPEGSDDYM